MNKKYGVVLVGCGYMGAAHMNERYFSENMEVRGVVDLNTERAKLFARKYGARSWSSGYEEYFGDPSTDIFIIATYPSSHLKILQDCLKYKKHVLCEKPITSTLEDASEFVRHVKKAESKVLIGHILRHNSIYQRVAEMIRDGFIGSPIVMRIIQNKHIGDWSRHAELLNNTSPIIDCGVHYIDVMQWFTHSKICSISGISAAIDKDVPEGKYNYGLFCAKLDDGSTAHFEIGWGRTIVPHDIKEFIGPKGSIRIVYGKDRGMHQEEGDLIEYFSCSGNEYKVINNKSKRKATWEQLQYLIKMIEENVEAVPTIDQVADALKIAHAADFAVKTGQVVRI